MRRLLIPLFWILMACPATLRVEPASRPETAVPRTELSGVPLAAGDRDPAGSTRTWRERVTALEHGSLDLPHRDIGTLGRLLLQ